MSTDKIQFPREDAVSYEHDSFLQGDAVFPEYRDEENSTWAPNYLLDKQPTLYKDTKEYSTIRLQRQIASEILNALNFRGYPALYVDQQLHWEEGRTASILQRFCSDKIIEDALSFSLRDIGEIAHVLDISIDFQVVVEEQSK